MTVKSRMLAPGRKVARGLLSSTEKSGRSVGAWVKEDDESEMRGAVEVTG